MLVEVWSAECPWCLNEFYIDQKYQDKLFKCPACDGEMLNGYEEWDYIDGTYIVRERNI